ncbi:chromosome transmission fidelity protein 18 homolog [Lingula anatina]|uniref:Chromosome transmission fidelity protein 18 homolog n=1 Tax=Lingula anatina TaxID=7574 RepID=A0A1S3IDP7_LINAN|nr:chromosome transmission fidelity protein 18 homolog [Lingula anatina]|eukprot:XP_013395574.1 chromosome transmission fidelity protein 18 homolog [Lingula anatina]
MEEDFEAMFADELEMMNEMDDYEPYPKSKRSLAFTPSKGTGKDPVDLNDSILTPLDSPSENTDLSNKRKKREKDVFGDLSDSDGDVEEALPKIAPQRKRVKLSPQKSLSIPKNRPEPGLDDFEITPPPSPTLVLEKRILAQRNKTTTSILAEPTNSRDAYQTRVLDSYDYDRPRVFRRIPAGNFISVTGVDGTRAYMKVKEDSILTKEEDAAFSATSSHLLGMSFEALKDQVEQERRNRVIKESIRLTNQLNREFDTDLGLDDELTSDLPEDHDMLDKEVESDGDMKHELWVEQYRPRQYTQLLSDESTNRTLLHWLKLWDHVVFGKEKKVPKAKQEEKSKKDGKKKNFKKQEEVTEDLDKLGRPMQKIALLCGPPGLGKTTLAHVIASHAGYNVVEMNASDDRSPEFFKNKIESATQMKAVMGADPRPNCLVIDEIDGAPSQSINILMSFIKGEEKVTKKKKKSERILLRPVICVCNDLYVPALRTLRQNALVLHFPPTASAQLASRLLEISRMNKISTDMSALLQLCEKTNNDIRSCLNTLQFVQRQKKELTMSSVQSLSVGQKDAHKSLFSVWQDIFQMPKPKRKRFVNPHERGSVQEMQDLLAQNNTSTSGRFQHIYEVAIAAGDHEKVTQGIFENYLEMKIKDPRFDGLTLASEWLCYTDLVNQQIAHYQLYIMMRYLPYLPVVFHLLFASTSYPKLSYPHSQYECTTKLAKSENLVNAMMNEMAPSVRKNLNIPIIVLEVLPSLLGIITPTLRPVNTQLYSAREKADMNHLIQIMIAYNMTYRQERTPEGQYTYVLDPSLDEVVHFTGLKPERQLTYAAKQLIAREIELEKMRRSEAVLERAEKQPVAPVTKKSANPAVPNHLQKLEAKPIREVEEKPAVDFFGRVIQTKRKKENASPENAKKKNILDGDVWFHFKEGYSNAVRRTVRVQDFL